MEAGDQNPEEAQESQDEKRIVEPEPAACINTHQNACSDEHLFERKATMQHKRITEVSCQWSVVRRRRRALFLLARRPLVVAILTLAWLITGCLPDPQRLQSVALLDQLVAARTMLTAQAPATADQACTTVGDVNTRLTGEPGLVDVRPAWPALRNATQALQAACGQLTMLGQPSTDSAAIEQARRRWQQGIQREIGVACDHLRVAAAALDRSTPC